MTSMSEEHEAIADVRDAFTKGRTYLYTQTGDIVCNIAELLAAYTDIRTQLAAARKERGELRQRVEQAEKAARTTIEDCRRQGVSIGRSLANYACKMERERAEAAERERDAYKANLPESVAEIVAGLSDDKHALLRKVEEQQGTISSLLQIRDDLRHRAESAERERDALQKFAALQDAWETEAMGDITMLLKERNEYRHRAERMGQAIADVKALRVSPQCRDGENNAEVAAYEDGYGDALTDVRDILRTLDASAGEG